MNLLALSVVNLVEEGRVAVLLAAQPDPQRADCCILEATAVAEAAPVCPPLRLTLLWKGGRRSVHLSAKGSARLHGVPVSVVQAIKQGDAEALRLQLSSGQEAGP